MRKKGISQFVFIIFVSMIILISLGVFMFSLLTKVNTRTSDVATSTDCYEYFYSGFKIGKCPPTVVEIKEGNEAEVKKFIDVLKSRQDLIKSIPIKTWDKLEKYETHCHIAIDLKIDKDVNITKLNSLMNEFSDYYGFFDSFKKSREQYIAFVSIPIGAKYTLGFRKEIEGLINILNSDYKEIKVEYSKHPMLLSFDSDLDISQEDWTLNYKTGTSHYGRICSYIY